MLYHLGVEDIGPNHWVAWVFELPGCFASAQTQKEAIAAVPANIAAYFAWLAKYGHTMPGASDAIETEVADVFHSFISEGDYIVNAFFDDDRRPLTQKDVEQALRLLDYTRQDLQAVLQHSALEDLAQPISGEVQGSIHGILRHVSLAERWYFRNIGLDSSPIAEDPLVALKQVREKTRLWLPTLVGDSRITEFSREQWSARKVLRRTLWHERDHTQQIRNLLRAKYTVYRPDMSD